MVGRNERGFPPPWRTRLGGGTNQSKSEGILRAKRTKDSHPSGWKAEKVACRARINPPGKKTCCSDLLWVPLMQLMELPVDPGVLEYDPRRITRWLCTARFTKVDNRGYWR